MVAIPVRLYKAARRERIRFHKVYRQTAMRPEPEPPEEEDEVPEPPPPPRAGRAPVREFAAPMPLPAPEPVARVRHIDVGEVNEEKIEPPEILKGFEVEKDRYVTFEQQEVNALRPETSTELEIAEFVRLAEIDPTFFDTSYYVSPDKGGEKAYALLFRALTETGYAAIGSLAMHGREHATAIRPGTQGLILHTLYFAKEVRSAEEYRADPSLVVSKELEMAKLFVNALAAKFDPEKLKDTFEERLQQLIQERSQTALAAYKSGEVARRAPVVDIMEALRKSLEMVRKPVKSEKADAKGARKPRARVH
jgi:DNA end-binding protein Ku